MLSTSTLFTSGAMPLAGGASLARVDLAYETWGELNATRDNAVLVCHGYTNNQHAAGGSGWYAGLIGPGKAVDTDQMFVVSSNMLGSSYGSTGPASIDPVSGRPYGGDFPAITVADMVRAQARLLTHLDVASLRAVIGNSYGGYLALQWAIDKPLPVTALAVVVSALRGRGDMSSVKALEDRFAGCSGWNAGQYYGDRKGSGVFDEMIRHRIETLQQYGVEQQLRSEFGGAQVARQLRRLASAWAADFDANSLIVLRKAAVQFDAHPSLSRIEAPLLYVLSRSDHLFPPSLAPATMNALRAAGVAARYVEIDSDNGHRASSVDAHLWADELRAFIAAHA